MTPDEYLRSNPRPAFVFRDAGSAISPDANARCSRCNGIDHLIEGDGPVVCRPYIDQLGAIAGDPHVTTHRVLEALQERHGDIVRIARTAGHDSRMLWDWDASWPGAGIMRLIDGGSA